MDVNEEYAEIECEHLTDGQMRALALARAGKSLFITGGAGTGKSFIVSRIISALQQDGKNVLVTASTAKAATVIGGATCHSVFRIPIHMAWNTRPTRASVQSNTVLMASDTIIIDEVSMLRIDTFDFIIATLMQAAALKRSEIQLIVVGDFAQLPPVIVRKKKNTEALDEYQLLCEHYGVCIGQGYAFDSPGWARYGLETVCLEETIRQTDPAYIAALNGLRMGDRNTLSYFTRNQNPMIREEGSIVLCGRNATADTINSSRLARLPGQSQVYRAHVSGEVGRTEFPVPPEIELKVGAPIIFMKNSKEYSNGQSGTVTGLYPKSITVKLENGNGEGDEVSVEYDSWRICRYTCSGSEFDSSGRPKVNLEEVGSFSQLPVRLAYAMSIHKSQGQTYSKPVIIRTEIFAPGQLYVALSRAKSISQVKIAGDLRHIDLLADPRVIDFYNGSLEPLKPYAGEEEASADKKPADDKKKPQKVSVALRMMPDMAQELRQQASEMAKGKGVSEIGIAGLDLVLKMPKKMFWAIQERAEKNGTTFGDEALAILMKSSEFED